MSPVVNHLWAPPSASGITPLGAQASFEGTTTTSHSVDLPPGAEVDDVLVAIFRISHDALTDPDPTVITNPAGWTTVGNGVGTRVATRKRLLGDPTTITFVTNNNRRSAAIVHRVGGAHGDVAMGSVATTDPGTLTPAWGSAENLWITFVGNRFTTFTHTPPADYGNTVYVESGDAQASIYHCALSSAYRILTAASENPAAWVVSGTSQTQAALIAVRPTP